MRSLAESRGEGFGPLFCATSSVLEQHTIDV